MEKHTTQRNNVAHIFKDFKSRIYEAENQYELGDAYIELGTLLQKAPTELVNIIGNSTINGSPTWLILFKRINKRLDDILFSKE